MLRNTTRGRKTRAEKKLPNGGMTPFGYKRISELHGGRFEVDPEEAAVVRQIFAWCAEGLSTRAIARKLTAARILTRLDRHPPNPAHTTAMALLSVY